MRDLQQSLEKLYGLRTFGIKPGLDAERALLERLGNPQHSFAAIHVAGTNGKGSVCAMLESVLRGAGLAVGLYTSPHLVRFNERIRTNGVSISDPELAELFDLIEPAAAAVKAELGGREITFFEFTTALAFEHFRRTGVKLAVLEAGMGGRLDATNVVLPLLSVITRIGVEHTEYLGATLEAIAGEKAGIIKPGRPVVCGAMPEAARGVIGRVAQGCGARVVEAAEVGVRRVAQDLAGQKVTITSPAQTYGTVTLPLLGPHQRENCATAVATLETLSEVSGLPLPPETVLRGLEATQWPARFQVLGHEPPVVLDAAHNPDGARMLAATLKEVFGKRPLGLVWGMCTDKDAAGFLRAMPATIRRCWAVPLPTERSRAPRELGELARQRGWAAQESALPEALAEAERWARANAGAVCIAGSLFLAGAVLALRGTGRS